jgi:hypothetical protein
MLSTKYLVLLYQLETVVLVGTRRGGKIGIVYVGGYVLKIGGHRVPVIPGSFPFPPSPFL